jgi:hypothetical protein
MAHPWQFFGGAFFGRLLLKLNMLDYLAWFYAL